MGIVRLVLAHDSSLWIQSKYFCWLCSSMTFPELLDSPHPAPNRIGMVCGMTNDKKKVNRNNSTTQKGILHFRW